MSHYRRSRQAGGSFFFTVVTYRRRPILCEEPVRLALREAIKEIQSKRPFTIEAWVLLPDHLHCLWTLPPDDADFSRRWGMIKRLVSIRCGEAYGCDGLLTASKRKHRESTIWQRRYWEHEIRDKTDFARHLDYIHYNPTRHGLCERPGQWPYSTLHRYIKEGRYPEDWAVEPACAGDSVLGE